MYVFSRAAAYLCERLNHSHYVMLRLGLDFFNPLELYLSSCRVPGDHVRIFFWDASTPSIRSCKRGFHVQEALKPCLLLKDSSHLNAPVPVLYGMDRHE